MSRYTKEYFFLWQNKAKEISILHITTIDVDVDMGVKASSHGQEVKKI